MTGGQAMVRSLVDHGVDTVFGIPGVQLDPLYDAFHAQQNRIRVLHTRHEQGAAFMAMGYAQASDRAGVFAVVPGPGLLNAMAGVSTAVAANAPVLGITGQIPSYQIGQGLGMAHELRDQLAMSQGVVAWARRAEHPSQVPALVNEAFTVMLSGRKQPVVLEMAPDQYAARAPVAGFDTAIADFDGPQPDVEKVAAMAEKLATAKAPAIFVGGGVFGACDALKHLAQRLNAPVIASISGRGALSDEHPLSFNILAGQGIWEQVDVALVVGTRFTAPAMAWGRSDEVTMLRIDIDPVQIAKPRAADIAVVSDARRALQALVDALDAPTPERSSFLAHAAKCRQQVTEQLAGIGPIPTLTRGLRSALPRDAIVVADVTQMGSFVRYSMPMYEPRTMLGPGYQATLGYGLPAALGAKVACPEKKVVAICGDGGFMFSVQELATAVHHHIPIVCVVLDNSSYGNVKTIQDTSFGGRNIAVELTNPDFCAMARSFGARAARVEQAEEFEGVISDMLASDEPALVHVPIGQVPSIWQFVKRPPSQGRAQ